MVCRYSYLLDNDVCYCPTQDVYMTYFFRSTISPVSEVSYGKFIYKIFVYFN